MHRDVSGLTAAVVAVVPAMGRALDGAGWDVAAAGRLSETLGVVLLDFFLQGAMEDKDEEAMQGVEGGEEVGHEGALLADEEEAKDPRQRHQQKQRDRTNRPAPDTECQISHIQDI